MRLLFWAKNWGSWVGARKFTITFLYGIQSILKGLMIIFAGDMFKQLCIIGKQVDWLLVNRLYLRSWIKWDVAVCHLVHQPNQTEKPLILSQVAKVIGQRPHRTSSSPWETGIGDPQLIQYIYWVPRTRSLHPKQLETERQSVQPFLHSPPRVGQKLTDRRRDHQLQ